LLLLTYQRLFLVSNSILPVEVFVPVDAFKAIPTNPSVESTGCVVGARVFIVPAFVTVEPALPKIPVDFIPCKVIVAPLTFVTVDLSLFLILFHQ